MTRYRPHRMFLDEAMAEAVDFNGIDELRKLVGEGSITFKNQGYDKRTGWITYLVAVDGQAVGHTDGFPQDASQSQLEAH